MGIDKPIQLPTILSSQGPGSLVSSRTSLHNLARADSQSGLPLKTENSKPNSRTGSPEQNQNGLSTSNLSFISRSNSNISKTVKNLKPSPTVKQISDSAIPNYDFSLKPKFNVHNNNAEDTSSISRSNSGIKGKGTSGKPSHQTHSGSSNARVGNLLGSNDHLSTSTIDLDFEIPPQNNNGSNSDIARKAVVDTRRLNKPPTFLANGRRMSSFSSPNLFVSSEPEDREVSIGPDENERGENEETGGTVLLNPFGPQPPSETPSVNVRPRRRNQLLNTIVNPNIIKASVDIRDASNNFKTVHTFSTPDGEVMSQQQQQRFLNKNEVPKNLRAQYSHSSKEKSDNKSVGLSTPELQHLNREVVTPATDVLLSRLPQNKVKPAKPAGLLSTHHKRMMGLELTEEDLDREFTNKQRWAVLYGCVLKIMRVTRVLSTVLNRVCICAFFALR
jgi:hypothetical protein